MKRVLTTLAFVAALTFASAAFADTKQVVSANEVTVEKPAARKSCLSKRSLDQRHTSCRGRSGRWW